MSTSGVYGTKIGSIVTPSDVDIFYSYSPTRNALDALNAQFKRLDSALLIQSNIEEANNTFQYDNIIEGLYNLKLPLEYLDIIHDIDFEIQFYLKDINILEIQFHFL